MSTFSITCPNCTHVFELGDDIKKKYQTEMKAWQMEQEDKYRKKEQQLLQSNAQKDIEWEQRLSKEKNELQQSITETVSKKLTADYEHEKQQLLKTNEEQEKKLEEARKLQTDYLQKERNLKTKEAELEITLQKQLNAEREKMANEIKQLEANKMAEMENLYKLKLAEKDKQIEDSLKLAEEMRRKAEQGSMQLQGEIQELLLEEILRQSFPFDRIEEVGKGIRGADCVQTVQNKFGVKAGSIIYESKRTKDFSKEWIEKLKADKLTVGADVAILVTQTLPKDVKQFGEKDGVYICTFNEVVSLVSVLRTAILKIYEVQKSQENRGDKMVMLYNYLTGSEFMQQWAAVREGFLSLKQGIQKERDAMEKIWKTREKQLEKVLLNSTHIAGSIEGIAGSNNLHLEFTDNLELGEE